MVHFPPHQVGDREVGAPDKKTLPPQLNAWQAISALQALQNYSRSHRAQMLFSREFHQVRAKAYKALAQIGTQLA